MGQIIGSAAKPKRCNLNKLSQLGTPAAGEYILVSSDNSMNAAGQGNFDAYVVGDGHTAATELPLHKFKAEELEEKLYGKEKVLMDNVTTQASMVYITADMVTAGDVLVFQLESINNLQGALRAEKEGYVFDQYITVAAGQSATVEYTVPENFLRIYTKSGANPVLVTCTVVRAGDIDKINDDLSEIQSSIEDLPSTYIGKSALVQDTGSGQNSVMSQKTVTQYGDSPFAVVVPEAMKGIVAIRMMTWQGDSQPVNNYTRFRVASFTHNSSWNLYLQVQCSTDGETWTNYDSIARLAADSPSPLPVIEEITSKYGRFVVVVNWPMIETLSVSSQNYVLKKDAPNYFYNSLGKRIDELSATVVSATDSPFAVVVPEAMKGIVAIRMMTWQGDSQPVNNYTRFRVASFTHNSSWNLYLQVQCSTDGETWTNYDSIARLAADSPSPLPVIEEITSKYGRFVVVVNWPMIETLSVSSQNYVLKKDAPNYFYNSLGKRIDELSATVVSATDSPFITSIPSTAKGLVAFRMENASGDNYTRFRVASIIHNSTWGLYLRVECSTDGETWEFYDSIDRLAADSPSPLPIIEEITSKYKRFKVIVNWPIMGTVSVSNQNYLLKTASPNYFSRKNQEQIDNIKLWPTWNDYELKDRTKQIVKVDINGNGDYTSIADAYAAITDSSYENQYEVVVYAGTYHEYNLIPPKFTHTHGLIPNSVIVTSEGESSTLPVFDQRVPCKLSNMTIVSGTGYCVHQDQSSLQFTMLKNENLHCKKVYGRDVSNFGFRTITNPSILGIGSHLYGAKFIWNNCIFEDGYAASHTVGGDTVIPANQHLIYKNCKLVNACIQLLVAGTSEKVGNFVCEIDGLYTALGCPSVICKAGTRTEGEETYNFPWQIIGGGNRNFVALTDNNLDTSVDDVWPNINTDNVTLVQLKESVSKNQFVNITGMVCDGGTDVRDIVGMALESGSAGDSIRVYTGCFAINNSFVGNNFPITTDDGNYGIGNDGRLLKNASNIIGRVKYNIFYINSQSN